MKFRDLPNGALFAYYPDLTCWVTALKVGQYAYLLKSGEQVEVHANKNVETIKPLTGTGYRLAVTRENEKEKYGLESRNLIMGVASDIEPHDASAGIISAGIAA